RVGAGDGGRRRSGRPHVPRARGRRAREGRRRSLQDAPVLPPRDRRPARQREAVGLVGPRRRPVRSHRVPAREPARARGLTRDGAESGDHEGARPRARPRAAPPERAPGARPDAAPRRRRGRRVPRHRPARAASPRARGRFPLRTSRGRGRVPRPAREEGDDRIMTALTALVASVALVAALAAAVVAILPPTFRRTLVGLCARESHGRFRFAFASLSIVLTTVFGALFVISTPRLVGWDSAAAIEFVTSTFRAGLFALLLSLAAVAFGLVVS